MGGARLAFCYHAIVLLIAIANSSGVLGRSYDNRRLLRVEKLQSIQFEIAPRPDKFYAKRDLSRNPSIVPSRPSSLEHDDLVRLQLNAYNQTFHLHLEPNLDLFHPVNSDLRPESFRIYRGHVLSESAHAKRQWEHGSAAAGDKNKEKGVLGWARIIVRQDLTGSELAYPIFEGAFQARGDMYHIKTLRNYKLAKRDDDAELADDSAAAMVIYRDSDTLTLPVVQPSIDDGVVFDRVPKQQEEWWGIFSAPQQQRVNAFPGMVKRDTTGCPSSTMIAYMVAAADCTYTKYYGSIEEARYQIINDWNSASAVYEDTFNIRLGLINITIMPEECSDDTSISWNRACSSSYTISERLSDFSLWRSYYSDDGAALYHLMTACSSGLEVGIAWLRQLCNSDVSSQTSNGVTQYVSGTGVSSIIRDEWKVVAHEIGHGFGAIHDCTSDTCPCSGSSCSCCPLSDTTCDASGTYIMNPTNNVSSNSFSPCSITTICGLYPTLGTCLESPGSRTIQTLQMCGNGIKEDGEDCDPGGKNSTCCDASTCKFINGAVCDDATDLCCNNCQLQPSTYTCRPAENECDVAEMCTGTSGDCPEDQHVEDGTSCGNDGLQCASGQCTSRDQQCIDRGSGLSITGACSALGSSCNIVCSASNTSSCIVFTGHFLDGTPCGLGGVCSNGDCDYGSAAHRALIWLQNNKAIAIPVGVVLAIILILLVCWCFFRGCCCWQGYIARRRKLQPMRAGPAIVPAPPPPPPHRAANRLSRHPAMPPPSYQQATSGWVDPTPYNGPPPPPPQPPSSSPTPPPPAPPAHTVRAQQSPS